MAQLTEKKNELFRESANNGRYFCSREAKQIFPGLFLPEQATKEDQVKVITIANLH